MAGAVQFRYRSLSVSLTFPLTLIVPFELKGTWSMFSSQSVLVISALIRKSFEGCLLCLGSPGRVGSTPLVKSATLCNTDWKSTLPTISA